MSGKLEYDSHHLVEGSVELGVAQDQCVKRTEFSAQVAEKNIRAIPADKLDWVPMGNARSVMDQLGELARFPVWIMDHVEGRPSKYDEKEGIVEWNKQFPTVDQRLAEFQKNTAAYCSWVKDIPDSRLGELVTLPWDKEPLGQVIGYHEWNNTYHLGQFCYIQMLLGDTEFHM